MTSLVHIRVGVALRNICLVILSVLGSNISFPVDAAVTNQVRLIGDGVSGREFSQTGISGQKNISIVMTQMPGDPPLENEHYWICTVSDANGAVDEVSLAKIPVSWIPVKVTTVEPLTCLFISQEVRSVDGSDVAVYKAFESELLLLNFSDSFTEGSPFEAGYSGDSGPLILRLYQEPPILSSVASAWKYRILDKKTGKSISNGKVSAPSRMIPKRIVESSPLKVEFINPDFKVHGWGPEKVVISIK